MLLTASLTACKDNTNQSHAGKELEEVAAILGETANDYLSTKITKDQAEEKLDVLSARLKAIEDEVTDSNDEKFDHVILSGKIVSFQYDMWKGTTDKISEIKEEYYKE